MTSPIVEYQTRHKTNCIPAVHNGVCFFDGNPPLIVTTSLPCRSFSICPSCDHSADIILEIFVPGYNGAFITESHNHVEASVDLVQYIKKFHSRHKPFYASKPRDLEIWLWEFCCKGMGLPAFKHKETEKELKVIEKMVWATLRYPAQYNSYYITYEAFLPARKYLLFK